MVPKAIQIATTLGAMEPLGNGLTVEVDDILVESKDAGRQREQDTQ